MFKTVYFKIKIVYNVNRIIKINVKHVKLMIWLTFNITINVVEKYLTVIYI